jgi:hypothetical protein
MLVVVLLLSVERIRGQRNLHIWSCWQLWRNGISYSQRWIKLCMPITGLFFPSETLPAGTITSIGDPRGQRLVSQGKATKIAFPPGSDPDDVEGLRAKYRKANGGKPLWDEQRKRSVAPAQPAIDPQAATIRRNAAANLKARIRKLLGPRSASAWFARERERQRPFLAGRVQTSRPLRRAGRAAKYETP